MKTFLSLVGIALVSLVSVVGGIEISKRYYQPQPVTQVNLGAQNDTLKATTTDSTWNATAFPTKFKVLKTGSGYLGSVVISGATAAAGLNFYDATTTGPHANHATTSIAVLNVSSPAGTYVYNVSFARGLIVEFPSSLGAASSTITWQ